MAIKYLKELLEKNNECKLQRINNTIKINKGVGNCGIPRFFTSAFPKLTLKILL